MDRPLDNAARTALPVPIGGAHAPAAESPSATEHEAARVADTYAPAEVKRGKIGSGPAIDLSRSWPHPVGQAFKIDGPLMFDGSGKTVTLTPERLTIDWDQKVPAGRDPGPETPHDGNMHIRFDLKITDAAAGRATFVVANRDDGLRELQHDENARFKFDPGNGKLSVDYKDKDDGKKHSFVFGPKGVVELDGHDHDTAR